MRIIQHRVNTIRDLIETNRAFGVEIDLRSQNGHLILNHDPFQDGELFEDWLKHFSHEFIILNVKEDGLEERVLEALEKANLADFFFLDQAFPSLHRMSARGDSRCAVRVSEFESVESALRLSGRVSWVWLDSFDLFSFTSKELIQLREAGFNLCLVSPELQGRFEIEDVNQIKNKLEAARVQPDAVCTKIPALWQTGTEET